MMIPTLAPRHLVFQRRVSAVSSSAHALLLASHPTMCHILYGTAVLLKTIWMVSRSRLSFYVADGHHIALRRAMYKLAKQCWLLAPISLRPSVALVHGCQSLIYCALSFTRCASLRAHSVAHCRVRAINVEHCSTSPNIAAHCSLSPFTSYRPIRWCACIWACRVSA